MLIVNPVAGGGRALRALREALPLFEQRGIRPEIHVTAAGDEPTGVAARAAAEGADLVVAVGGDGHLAAVGEGLTGSDVPMAVLPGGSANDYARTIDMSRRGVRDAVDAMLAGHTVRVDTISVTAAGRTRTFLNVVGAGFDADVAAAAERITVMRGAGRYVLAILLVLPRFNAARLRLTIDGHHRDQKAMMIAVANGPAYGGGMRVAPDANLASGELEICIVGEISKAGFIRAFPSVFRGTHVTHPAVTMLRCREVEIDAELPIELIGDGERIGRTPATVRVVPRSLSVIVGPAYATANGGKGG